MDTFEEGLVLLGKAVLFIVAAAIVLAAIIFIARIAFIVLVVGGVIALLCICLGLLGRALEYLGEELENR